MIDPNNRPGGAHLIVTCKSADKIQFFDPATLALSGEIDMPGSTHELILPADGKTAYGSVYGGGIFGRNKNPDRRIAVIDLAAKKLQRTIDVGADVAPHSVMMDGAGTLWATAELANSLLAIEPQSGGVTPVNVGGSPHWIAVSHSAGKVFASFKTQDAVAVVDTARRAVAGTIEIPHGAEGVAVTPDGETLFVCAHWKGVFHQIDTRTHELRRTLSIAGAPGEANQLRRVRVSPDGRFVCVSCHVDNYAAVYESGSLKQIGGFSTPKAPMGFGFAADGKHAYLCCHDAAVVVELDLANASVTRQFPTAAGCEFVLCYA